MIKCIRSLFAPQLTLSTPIACDIIKIAPPPTKMEEFAAKVKTCVSFTSVVKVFLLHNAEMESGETLCIPGLLLTVFVHKSLRLHSVLYTFISPAHYCMQMSVYPATIYIFSFERHTYGVQIFPPWIQHHSQAANLVLKEERNSLSSLQLALLSADTPSFSS